MKDQIDAVVAAFNRGSLDVPAHLFTPRTTFTMNNRSYESILGGSPDDPLVRLLARGVAGYRTAAKALQYALQGPVVTLESLAEPDDSGVYSATARVEGRLRQTGELFSTHLSMRLTCAGLELLSVDMLCPEEDLTRIAASRGV